MRNLFLFTLSILLFKGSNCEDKKGVVTLTSDNYEAILNENKLVVSMYYAPWCMHCKKLKPEYEKVCETVHEKHPQALCGYLDCTTNEAVCAKLKLEGYPSIMSHRGGSTCVYNGPREYEAMVSWVDGSVLSMTGAKSKEEVQAFIDTHPVAIIGYFTDAAHPNIAFAETIVCSSSSVYYILLQDKEIAESFGLDEENKFYVFKDKVIHRKIDAVKEKSTLSREMHFSSTPLVPEYTPTSTHIIFSSDISHYLALIHNSSNSEVEKYTSVLHEYATSAFGNVRVFTVDILSNENSAVVEYFRVTKTPVLCFYNDVAGRFFHYHEEDLSVSGIQKFVEGCISGQIPHYVRRQSAPDNWDEGPVRTLVVDTFEASFESGKPHLVLFYATWCAHCQKLKSTWETLAKSIKESGGSVIVAQVDHPENDIEDISVSRYPTIVAFKTRNDFSFYEGENTLEAITKFMNETFGEEKEDTDSKKVEEKHSEVDEKHPDL